MRAIRRVARVGMPHIGNSLKISKRGGVQLGVASQNPTTKSKLSNHRLPNEWIGEKMWSNYRNIIFIDTFITVVLCLGFSSILTISPLLIFAIVIVTIAMNAIIIIKKQKSVSSIKALEVEQKFYRWNFSLNNIFLLFVLLVGFVFGIIKIFNHQLPAILLLFIPLPIFFVFQSMRVPRQKID